MTYKEERKVKLVHAAQQDGIPVGTTSGLYEVSGVKFTLLRDSANGLLADLAILGLGSYGDAEFTYILQLFEIVPTSIPPQVPSLPLTLTINGCRVTGVEEKAEVGSDELVTDIEVTAKYIFRPTGNLWSVTRGLLP